jgi:hypothetical protein
MLTKAMTKEGKIRTKVAERQEQAKKNFLNEKLRFVMIDGMGKIIPDLEWKPKRSKFSMTGLQAFIKRSPYPNFELDFYCNEEGDILDPADTIRLAEQDPRYYTLIPKVRRLPVDINRDPRYVGQSVMILKNMPLRSKNAYLETSEQALRAYFMYAIIEDDPVLKPVETEIDRSKALLEALDKRTRLLKKQRFFDDNGNELSEGKSEEERDVIYKYLGNERNKIAELMRRQEEVHAKFTKWRKGMGISFELAKKDKVTQTADWFVRFFGVQDAKKMEDLMIAKTDWPGILLATSTGGCSQMRITL